MIGMLVNAVKHSGGERREGGGVEGQNRRRGEQIGDEEQWRVCVCGCWVYQGQGFRC